MAYDNRNLFPTAPEGGSSADSASGGAASWFVDNVPSLSPHLEEGERALWGPIRRLHPHDTVTLGVRISTDKFDGTEGRTHSVYKEK